MIVLRRLFQDRGAIFAIAIITIYVVLGVLAPLITFYEPNHIDTANKFAGISWSHWLGTDHLGRDVLTLSLIHISEHTRRLMASRMPSSA